MSVRNREQVLAAVAGSFSIRGALKKMRLAPAGGNYETFRKAVQRYAIDTSHFTGQGHLRGKTHNYGTRSLRTILVRGKFENTNRLKRRLIVEGLKERRCEACRLEVWRGKPIPLELHHHDGDRTNNTLRNLKLLCPNCHAQTDNYRSKNRKA